MFRLNFTSHVLGPDATEKLRRHEVTQTIRSKSCDIVVAFLNGMVKRGDQVEVFLDGEKVGNAEVFYLDIRMGDELDEADAKRGGFNTRLELVGALRRAGYRFKSLKDYEVYRVQFSWLEGLR